MAKILIGCEESQAVCIAFRELGHEAYSCDTLPCSGGHPEWHLQMDIFEAIAKWHWDMMIAFPPCTHLCVSGARYFEQKRADGRQQSGIDFFMALVNAPIEKIAIENPIGIMSNVYRKPDQIVQPWMFGDEARKSTCLWLKNLPLLLPTQIVGEGENFYWIDGKTGKQKKQPKWYADAFLVAKNKEDRAKIRSKTFKGLATAMANQWNF